MTAETKETPWAIAKAAYLETRSFEVRYDLTTWMPAYKAWQADGTAIPADVDAEMERLQEARCKAEDALYETPVDSIADIAFKIEIGRKRWVDFTTPDEVWDAIEDDLASIQARFAEAWLERFVKGGGSVVICPDGKAQFGVLMYDLTADYRAMEASEDGRKLRDLTYQFRDGHHHGAMNAMLDNLRYLPGGAGIIKQHMIDLGQLVRFEPSGDPKVDYVQRAVVETAEQAAARVAGEAA